MSTSEDRLLVRADAGVATGLGHVMRCLALAQAWQDHCGPAGFLVPPGLESLSRRLREEAISVTTNAEAPGSESDAEATAACAGAAEASWVVADGYAFGTDFQTRLRADRRLLVVDDTAHVPRYEADIILNQNIDSERLEYARPNGTLLLLGTRYALLRREFADAERPRREFVGPAERILVTMGGSDPRNLSGRVMEALAAAPLDGAEITVVVGPQNPHREELELLVETRLTESGASWVFATDPDRLAPLLEGTDLAISAAGSTTWEIAYLGVPALLVEAASNQERIARGLERMGAARGLGRPDEAFESRLVAGIRELRASPDRRRKMSEVAMALVDGEGAGRSIQAMTGLPVRLRKARRDDVATLFRWANDPSVRQSSFSPAPIPWENHEAWFHGKLRDERTFLFIGVAPDDAPAGVLRFDVADDGEAEVDIALDAARRGRGVGAVMLELGVRRLSRVPSVRKIVARVREENSASRRLFEKAGFRREDPAAGGRPPSVRYVRGISR